MLDDIAFVDRAWAEGLRPPPPITVSQWAEKHRVLARGTARPGRWNNSVSPHLVEIMDAMSPMDPAERVVVMGSAQSGKTEAILNTIGCVIHYYPGYIMIVWPNDNTVKKNSQERIDPLILNTPELRDLVAEDKARDGSNTIAHKTFPGGALMISGSNSSANLKSFFIQYLFLDEVDSYPVSASKEGDPVELALRRTATFAGRRKIILTSTPTTKGESRIEAAYLESDQRVFELCCPDCGEFAPISWDQISWPRERRDEAFRFCPKCGSVHHHHMKPSLLASGRWVPTALGDGRTKGYHLHGLLSSWTNWGEIAQNQKAAGKAIDRQKTWKNQDLGEPWEDELGELDVDDLPSRARSFGDLLPTGVVILTAGIDVQPDRLEVTVFGWGYGEEVWVVSHTVIFGDPTLATVWESLDDFLAQRWPHALDIPDLPIAAACIDSGGSATQHVCDWGRDKVKRRFWLIKGRSRPGEPVWPKVFTRAKGGAVIHVLNVDGAKETLYARLKVPEPGAGFIHFNTGLPASYFDQLVAERVKVVYRNGRPLRQWVCPPDRRNEGLDCAVYGYAALCGLRAQGYDLNAKATWQANNAKPRPKVDPAPAEDAATHVKVHHLPKRPMPKQQQVIRSSFVGGG